MKNIHLTQYNVKYLKGKKKQFLLLDNILGYRPKRKMFWMISGIHITRERILN